MTADVEKTLSVTDGSGQSCSSGGESPILEPLSRAVTSRTRSRSRHSLASTFVDSTDIYQNLEHAVSATFETERERSAREPITYTKSGASANSVASRSPEYEVYFEPNDPENPQNWSILYRAWNLAVVSFGTWLVVLYSTIYMASTPGLMEEFDTSQTVTTLGVTTYLLGLAIGSLALAPMSELYGRQRVYLLCFSVWAILTIPCAIGPSLTTVITVRFLGGLFGAAMLSNAPGTVVDITKPEYLSLGMSVYCVAPLNGPVLGPLIGGFVYQYKGWRWTSWVVLILAAVALSALLTLKETYPPTILRRKAARLRKETDDPRWWCQYDQKVSTLQLLKINLSRPLVMVVTEPILLFMDLWVALVYGILYLCFIAYPIVFSKHRSWGPGVSGLAYLGIGVGTVAVIVCEPLIRSFINKQPRDPVTGRVLPEAAALVMGFGAILTSIGQLGFSWTCLPTSIHWIVPILFGIPFGAGNTFCFIYSNNYLAGAYSIYAASALASSTVLRSVFGGTLPLVGPKLYLALGPQWAGTLLGFLEVITIAIPFVFWRYGSKIRSKSRMLNRLQEEVDAMEQKRARDVEKRKRRARHAAEDDEQGNNDTVNDETDGETAGSERRGSELDVVDKKESITTVEENKGSEEMNNKEERRIG
ncbi:major facilitator superfamily domain-containing protein [Trichoderma chlorosporum]